ncbi:MAG: hypothetical protein RBT41_01740 [Clostridia bacterium]|jgi:hypothetical protein|nr:hypothetical protein [Clostridia bacterium]
MDKKLYCLFIFIILLCSFIPAAASAADEEQKLPLANLPQPFAKTAVGLAESAVFLDIYEEVTGLNGTYKLFNASDKKTALTLMLPSSASVPVLSLNQGVSQEPYIIDPSKKLYLWQISFAPGERKTVSFAYGFPHTVDTEGVLTTGVEFLSPDLWSAAPEETSVSISLQEVTPAQFLQIQPQSFSPIGEGLSFFWNGSPNCAEILLQADLRTIKKGWDNKFSEREKTSLEQFLSVKNFQGAAFLFANIQKNTPSRDKIPLRTGQAYYLERAGKHEEALEIWEELFDDEAISPYIYWYLGRKDNPSVGKLDDLYDQVRELQIHPLLQQCLASRLPASRIEHAEPETISVRASTKTEKDGVLLSGSFFDADGDIEKITLQYRTENSPTVDEEFVPEPFQYTHSVSYFIPMEKTMQKVYYQFFVTDAQGNTIKTEQKEVFFLTSEIQSTTYPLQGAKLVLGEYLPPEQDKVYNWFKSYLQMAKAADFIPLGGKDPYFIFLGKYHPLIDTYQGPLFLLYTPGPFSPTVTKPAVHSYFLSYWYGPGWAKVPQALLLTLGDGLLLGQGDYVQTLRYLKYSNAPKFYEALNMVGQGSQWNTAIQEIYQMSLTEIKLRTLWFIHGHKALAIVIIVGFAWLGKSGLLARLLKSLR